MIKHSRLKGLFLIFLLIPIIGSSQALDHIQGEILYRLTDSNKHVDFQEAIIKNYPNLIHKDDFQSVSSSFNVWKLSFDHNQIDEIQFLATTRKHLLVESAQYNYVISNRTEPNDPLFPDLWHLKNTGQSGGLPGVDLDMTQTWFTSTGGVTFLGDTVVICVIDEKFDYDHIDLQDNIWVNHGEIPNDGIDNDENGYTDDFWGWNVETNNDDIGNTSPNDWHGTAVTGVAGAVGNNNTGISGVCWNIKLMLVSRGNTAADAIAAYTYPYESRKSYNQSNGEEGAYVVATNASWGTDFGTPADAPLWCAIYDSLGSVGVLNAAATTNSNVDVDVVGDLPTTCTSDFLITTTSVDYYDHKTDNAGFGATSIDLGAFGKNILTTFNEDTYSSFNGTSAAAPQVSGTIALLHTAPCPDFATLAKYDPEIAALQLKTYILHGTEPNISLEGITVTGGRLNTLNSLQLIMDNCPFAGCYSPFAVNFNPINTNSMLVEWQNSESTDFVHFQYKPYGSSSWTTIENVISPLTIEDLSACNVYEYRFRTFCFVGSDVYSEVSIFESDGCCYAPDNFSFIQASNEINISWNPVTTATGYLIQYREQGTTLWSEQSVVNSTYLIENLVECQPYEFRVKSSCPNIQSIFSSIQNVATIGCDACTEFTYCSSYGAEGSLTWINNITLADLNHDSGESMNGYSDFTDQTANLIQGFVHDVSITMDYDLFQFPAFFSIWVDLNQNGVFGENELLHQSFEQEVSTNGTLIIPADALIGSTRMRISTQEFISGPCGISPVLGEVEDYCVFISEPTECLPPVNFTVDRFESTALLNWSGNLLVDNFDLNYREAGTLNWIMIDDIFENHYTLTDLQPCTDYEFYLTSVCGGENSMAAPSQYFTSLGCGGCIDDTYCGTPHCQVDFEWIERIRFNDFENESGPNNGYGLFSDFTTDLIAGENYYLEMEPGFANDTSVEYFSVWIDYNLDGAFNNSNEKVIEGASLNGETVSGNILIPTDVMTGSTRIRISMKQAGPLNDPCENNFDGEIEEYCINILESELNSCPYTYVNNLFPIDSTSINVILEENPEAISYKIRYRPSILPDELWKHLTTVNSNVFLNDLLPCEDYDVQVQTFCEASLSNFGDTYLTNPCFISTANVELKENVSVKIFPNPFSEKTNLHLEVSKNQKINLVLYSGIGQMVQEHTFNANSGSNVFELNLADIPSGIYFLNLSSDRSILATKRLIRM